MMRVDGAWKPAEAVRDPRVVISGAFINFLLHNHSVIYKIIIFFPAKQKTAQFFPFLFCFISFIGIYSPLVSISQIIN